MGRLIPILVLFACLPDAALSQEIRAFWADGFAEGFKNSQQVDLLLERVKKANCNAVFAQMRKSADAYYQSRYDIWAVDNPQRFDALRDLIEKAHAAEPPIQVHAWLNTFAVGKDRGNPLHVTRTHPEWISTSDSGETHDGEATKLDPGHPEAAEYTARVYLDVLRNYDVDGIHFDFVRYGGARWGYNPVSVSRFITRYGLDLPPEPNDPAWKQWRRDQVTAVVRKVYVLAAALKPKAQVSAATITWESGPRTLPEWEQKSAAMNRVFQDWRSWMIEGILDLNCLMSYYDERKHPDWYRRWLEWAKDNQFSRWAALANGSWLNYIPDSLNQIAAIRKPSRQGSRARGVMLYCYAATNKGADGKEQRFNEAFYSALSRPSVYSQNPPFANPSTYPAMPWKEKPTTGNLYGFVFSGPEVEPADGAELNITGRGVRRSIRTDGAGFFAAVGLSPGKYAVALRRSRAVSHAVSIEAGKAARTVFTNRRSSPGSPIFRQVSDLKLIGAFSPVTLSDLVVVAGTDTMPGQLFVTDSGRSGVLRVELGETPGLAFQPGDEVFLSGQWDPTEGEPVVREARARWIGIRGGYSPDSPFLAEVKGTIIRTSAGKIVVRGEEEYEVALGARKGPGIEDAPAQLPTPPVGSILRVRGIALPLQGIDGIRRRIYPVRSEDLQVLSSPAANTVRALFLWVGISLAAGITTYAALRLMRRR